LSKFFLKAKSPLAINAKGLFIAKTDDIQPKFINKRVTLNILSALQIKHNILVSVAV